MIEPPIAIDLSAFEARVTEDWKHLSTRVTPSGTRSVAFAPWLGSHAWLHQFYSRCSVADLDACEDRIGRSIPAEWRAVLACINGMDIFIDGLLLRGILPTGLDRRRIEDPQPMSFAQGNTSQRPNGKAVSPEDLVIGFTGGDEIHKLLLRPDGTIAKVTRYGERLATSYPSTMAMINAEYEALTSRYGRDGRELRTPG